MSSPATKINPIDVKIMLISKDIKRKYLKKKLKVGDAAISMALSGKRPTLLNKINEVANNYPKNKKQKEQ